MQDGYIYSDFLDECYQRSKIKPEDDEKMKNKDLPAMPIPLTDGQSFSNHTDADGLTKREYFAAHAPDMPEFWFNEQEHDGSNYQEFRVRMMCKWRWHYADMMLEGE